MRPFLSLLFVVFMISTYELSPLFLKTRFFSNHCFALLFLILVVERIRFWRCSRLTDNASEALEARHLDVQQVNMQYMCIHTSFQQPAYLWIIAGAAAATDVLMKNKQLLWHQIFDLNLYIVECLHAVYATKEVLIIYFRF